MQCRQVCAATSVHGGMCHHTEGLCHLLHVVCVLDVLLEFATQSVLVVYKGMVHLQPCTAVPPYSKLKLLQHRIHDQVTDALFYGSCW